MKQPSCWSEMLQLHVSASNKYVTFVFFILCHINISTTLNMEMFSIMSGNFSAVFLAAGHFSNPLDVVLVPKPNNLMWHLYSKIFSEGLDNGAKRKAKGARTFLTILTRSWDDRRRLHRTFKASNYCLNNFTQTTNVKLVAGGKVTGVLRIGCPGARNVQKCRLTLSSPEPSWWWKRLFTPSVEWETKANMVWFIYAPWHKVLNTL